MRCALSVVRAQCNFFFPARADYAPTCTKPTVSSLLAMWRRHTKKAWSENGGVVVFFFVLLISPGQCSKLNSTSTTMVVLVEQLRPKTQARLEQE